MVLRYNTTYYEAETIQRLLNHWRQLILAFVAEPNRPVHQFNLLDPAEYQQLIYQWNETAVDHGPPETIHALFEQQVARTPQETAVVCGEQQLTYHQLNQRADQVAYHLKTIGVTAETAVGLYVERSLDMVVGLLAILKAGGAYVPLDPLMPTQRLQLMIEDMAGEIIVTQDHLSANLAPFAKHLVCLDHLSELTASPAQHHANTSPENLAYILYTSGSTGKPKGVAVEHRQVVAYGRSAIERCQFEAGMHYAMVQPLTVDSCVTMLYPSLWTGGTLHIIGRDLSLDAPRLAATFQQQHIDCLKIAPSHLGALLAAAPEPQTILPRKRLIIGGEASQWAWVQELVSQSDCLVYNHYGPTETTVGVTTYWVKPEAKEHPFHTAPIGRPLSNTTTYILDPHLQPTPIGSWGELHIGGQLVTRGYINRPDLTQEKFIPNPFTANGRLYKTGDWARYLPDGTIEFFGRMDGQVKIRGYRIELGEIENLLTAHPEVSDATVMVRQDGEAKDKRIVAYFVPINRQDEQIAHGAPSFRASLARLHGSGRLCHPRRDAPHRPWQAQPPRPPCARLPK